MRVLSQTLSVATCLLFVSALAAQGEPSGGGSVSTGEGAWNGSPAQPNEITTTTRTTKLQPGETWFGPDGEVITNDGTKGIVQIVTVYDGTGRSTVNVTIPAAPVGSNGPVTIDQGSTATMNVTLMRSGTAALPCRVNVVGTGAIGVTFGRSNGGAPTYVQHVELYVKNGLAHEINLSAAKYSMVQTWAGTGGVITNGSTTNTFSIQGSWSFK